MDSEKLLLVEDDEVFARVISRALKHRNFSVSHAKTSDEAFQLIKDSNFAFGILDLNLGGETSLNLIPILKKQLPGIRILILTGYASIATAVEAIKLGADNYLAKPADADEILSAMLAGDEVTMEPNESPRLEPMSVRRLEWEHIQRVLMENNGNISATARQLKMHRRTLQRKLQKRPVAK
ncbi:MAG: response regulator transcription factor [Pseudohongiellaceae bacterium]|nr:two-component system response regulator [Gammaproteobacteria bacterium]|tara:strand:+ start:105 stop:647 length:543 start_codon:yes stop_codon:yes gene_type:complete